MKNFTSWKPRIARRGFTLIELIVVVMIIGIIASLATPAFMKVKDRALVQAAHQEKMMSDETRDRSADPGISEERPVIREFLADWSLQSGYQKVGLEVYSRYQLSAKGTIRFASGTSSDGNTTLFIPFPKGTIEASNVYLRFVDDNGIAEEPPEATYLTQGIFWTGAIDPLSTIQAEFGYTSLGTEAVEIALPPARRLSDVSLSLDLSGTPANSITSYSLIPTTSDDSLFQWKFDNLVSNRNINIKLPGAQSPGGRLLTLLRFMAVAVFLFGAGFLYMNESQAPGRLDRFRLGHFALLALNYSLFFIVFGVIIYREHLDVLPALVIAAVGSLPLLIIHVARITDFPFAMKHILPLAVGTLTLVINGVYGGEFRDYGFLVLLIALTTYLTITYRSDRGEEDEQQTLHESA